MKTRAVSATLVAFAFFAPLVWLLSARVPATTRRPLSSPPSDATAFAVEIPELRYLRVRGGGSVHRIRLSTRNANNLIGRSAISLLMATYETKPVLDRAELLIEGTNCVFRTPRGESFPNNGLLTLERGRTCGAPASAPAAADLRLTVQFDNVARAALWADPAIERDLNQAAIVVSDRSVPEAAPRPMPRGALIDVDWSKQLPRAHLLAYVWQISGSPRWIWIAVGASAALAWIGVFLLAVPRGDSARAWVAQTAAGGFCAAAALTLAYAVLVPPFQSADESHHFAGFADFAGRPELITTAEEWARLGHFERIQFHPEEHFTPADVGIPGKAWDDEGTVPDPSQRGAAVQWLWRAVPAFVRALPAPQLLLALRLIDGALFGLAVAAFLGIVTATTGTRHPELFAIPLFLVPTLPFFAMTVSNYALLTAAYVLITAGILLDFTDGRGEEWAGPLIGSGWMVAALTARSAVPLAPFLAAWLLGRLTIGRRDPRWRPALVYWLGVTAFLVAGVWLADPGYVRTTVGIGEQKVSGIFVRLALIVLAHPWLLVFAGLAAAAIEQAIPRQPAAPPALRTLLRGAAFAAPLLMVASLAGSVLYRYPKVAFVDSAHPPAPAAYVKSVMAAALTTFRVTNLDFLTSWSFWGGFGWLETVPPAAFVSVLVSASGLAFAGLVYLLARQGDVRRLIRVGLAVAGAAASMAAYALSVVIVTPADLHGRYLIGLYLCALTIAWMAIPLFVSERPRWGGVIRSGCAAAFVAVHVVSLAVILTRYF